MSDLYLILHKVRGEPAFDIAARLQIGSELGWIIPTSGHRARPWWWVPLGEFWLAGELQVERAAPSMPPDWPDHYAVMRADPPARKSSTSLADLGLE